MDDLKDVIRRIILNVANRETEKLMSVEDDTIIFGEGAAIDSLDLVNILVEIEEWIHENLGREIELVDEDSLISEDSPFKTPATIALHAKRKISDQ